MAGINATSSPKQFEMTPGWCKSVEQRIAKKAGLKPMGGGVYGRKTWGTKISQALADGRAAGVVGKAYHESNHYVQAALLRETFRADPSGAPSSVADSINSPEVKNRIYRQDNIRFRPEIFEHSDTNQISGRNKLSYRLARASHFAHGVCEVMAAPTGFSQTALKNTFTPHATQKGLVNRLGMVATLFPIGALLSTVLSSIKGVRHLHDSAFTVHALGQTISYTVGAIPIAFSTFSAAAGGTSAVLGAISQAVLKKDDLNTNQQQEVLKARTVLLKKLDGLLGHIQPGTQGHAMLCRAMNRKISAEFRNPETGEPVLLARLIHHYDRNATPNERQSQIASTVGRYLAEVPQLADNQKNGVTGKLRCYFNEKAHLQRERHFVGLCDLIDHMDLSPPPANAKDLRRAAEGKLDVEGHPVLARALQTTLRTLPGFKDSRADKNLTARQQKGYKGELAAKQKAAFERGEKTTHIDRILSYSHQYSRATVLCARIGEGLRRASLDVLLARNAQISRGFFNVFIRVSNLISSNPVSRTMVQGVARLFGGTVLSVVWAGLTAATGGAFAALHVAQLTGSGLRLGKGVISFLSAGFMMFTFNLAGMGFSLVARGMAATGGYKGASEKPMPSATSNAMAAGWFDPSGLALVK